MFTGRVGRTSLDRGTYVFTLTPTDAARNRGAARPIGFRVA